MLFCSDVLLPFSHIPRCIHAKTPDFPRLFEPRGKGHLGLTIIADDNIAREPQTNDYS